MKLTFPQDGAWIVGPEFTLRGVTDDPSAAVLALITDSAGKSRDREGVLGRNGEVWVEGIPLSEGYTFLTLVAIDAAGNSSVTNVAVRKSKARLVMDPVPASQLWKRTVTVTGSFDRTDHTIWVNGVKAVLDETGRWKAEHVPVTEGGVAYFDVAAIPPSGWEPEEAEANGAAQPIVWGETTNGLRAGIGLLAVGTNQFNHYPFRLYVTNDAAATMDGKWMRPAEPSLCVLRLFDPQGRAVPRNGFGKRTEAALREDLNIHRLSRRDVGLLGGVLSCPAGRAVCLTASLLGEQFVLSTPGIYRLEAAAWLYRIEADGRLAPICLPPVSLDVKVIDQPAEIVFHLNELQREGRLWWSAARDGLRVGLAYEHNYRPKIIDRFHVYVVNQSTNRIPRLMLPPSEEQFEISLYDSRGQPVPKTSLGKRHGQPLSLPRWSSRRRLRPVGLEGRDATYCLTFDLHDHFHIPTPGKYRLTYLQRLYRPGSNGELEGVTLPMLMVPIEISITPSQE